LDEPTSHLDRESETLVLEAASRLMRDRTVLVIAHRPEPVAGADMVVTIRAGRVVGDEPPDAPNGLVVPIASEGRT
jgi:ABC-type multidrug transport system fused ATPase/permease subunit